MFLAGARGVDVVVTSQGSVESVLGVLAEKELQGQHTEVSMWRVARVFKFG